jgi:hypothetical protein
VTATTRILSLAAACAVIAGVVWLSSVPITAHASSAALLRLAWSARPERVEDCRQRSAEELANLPQHMRQPLACEGTTAEYRLQVRAAGALVVDRVVRGGGMRHDRRLYVLEEVPVPAGDTDIQVRFDRVETARSASTGPPQRIESVPPHLDYEQRITFRTREVVLITYTPDVRALAAVQGSSDPAHKGPQP